MKLKRYDLKLEELQRTCCLLRQLPAVRAGMVADLRRRLRDGSYEWEDRLDRTAKRVLAELTG